MSSSTHSLKPLKPIASARPEGAELRGPVDVGAARAWGRRVLELAGVPSFALDADLLVAQALGVPSERLFLHRDSGLNERQVDDFVANLHRRALREPLAYIVGHKEFFGLDLAVDGRALVPRPSTEVVVEVVLEFLGVRAGFGVPLRPDPGPAPLIVDIGAGSGAIALALAIYLPSARVLTSDISYGAATLAAENSRRLGLEGRVHVLVADGQPRTCTAPDLLVANLPYIRSAELLKLAPEVRDHEPRLALDGGVDGFGHYREFIAAAVVNRGGALVCEIGHDQRQALIEAVARRAPHLSVAFRKDLEGFDRVAVVTGWH